MISFTSEAAVLVLLMTARVYSQDCGDVTLTDNSGTFTSPNYPKDHGHSRHCKWTIRAEEGNFVELSFPEMDLKSMFLKCDHDYVIVDNGTTSKTYCNIPDHRPPKVIKSEANEIVVTFESDDFYRNGKGFKAVYEIVDKNGLPLDEQDEESEDYESESGKVANKSMLPEQSTTSKPESANAKIAKPRKSKKGKKRNKKNRKSKEERRRERKLRRQKAKALKRGKNKKNKSKRSKKNRKRGKRAKSDA